MYGLAVLGSRTASWTLAAFVGSAAALILPAHIVIAVLGLVGVGSVCVIRLMQSLVATRHLPVVPAVWRRTFAATGIALMATVGWGLVTGHGIGTSGVSPSISPFNAFWRETVATIVICSGAFLAIAVAWFMVRKERSVEAGLYIGTGALLVAGTLVWGARLADFNTFHLFYGGLAVFAAPVAAVAVVGSGCACAPPATRDWRSSSSCCAPPSLNSGRSSASVGWGCSDPTITSQYPGRSWRRSGASRQTPSSPTPAGHPRRLPSGTHNSSASTRTPVAGSCRCASRPRRSA